jgi:signal transduction histidine kinase
MEEQFTPQYTLDLRLNGDATGRPGPTPPEATREHQDLAEQLQAMELALQRAEAESLRLAGLLVEAEEALRNTGRQHAAFLAALVHELRNPLNPILTSAQLLRRRGHERPDLLETATVSIERQVRRLSRMIWDVSDFARIGQQDGADLKLESQELDGIALRAAEASRAQIEKRCQALACSLKAGSPVQVLADPARLERAVEILLTHASRFIPGGETIRLETGSDGCNAMVLVRAHGLDGGVPLDRLFEPYTRLGPPLHGGQHEGMGINLALAKHYVRLHGGEIAVRRRGDGAEVEFVARLPLAPAASGAAAA